MKICMRRYGEAARIVAVIDGRGAAHDPDGLDHSELKRLIDAEAGIRDFNPGRLRGPGAQVISAADREGARQRNELTFRVPAEVFVPAGGRPRTIGDANWPQFLDESGTPTARAVVEGANLFFSSGARAGLQQAGVVMVHGSSANKGGVICSSYEVLAGLLLDDDEFAAVRETYVREVLSIIAERCRSEARLLLREHRQSGGARPLTELSMAISDEINALADRVREGLGGESGGALCADPLYLAQVLDYCPRVIAEKHAERPAERLPPDYIHALIAHHVAAQIVYAEGLGWLSRLADVRGALAVARGYLQQADTVDRLVAGLGRSRLAEREALAEIVRHVGRKYLTLKELGLE